jgi:hypothetical protein
MSPFFLHILALGGCIGGKGDRPLALDGHSICYLEVPCFLRPLNATLCTSSGSQDSGNSTRDLVLISYLGLLGM